MEPRPVPRGQSPAARAGGLGAVPCGADARGERGGLVLRRPAVRRLPAGPGIGRLGGRAVRRAGGTVSPSGLARPDRLGTRIERQRSCAAGCASGGHGPSAGVRRHAREGKRRRLPGSGGADSARPAWVSTARPSAGTNRHRRRRGRGAGGVSGAPLRGGRRPESGSRNPGALAESRDSPAAAAADLCRPVRDGPAPARPADAGAAARDARPRWPRPVPARGPARPERRPARRGPGAAGCRAARADKTSQPSGSSGGVAVPRSASGNEPGRHRLGVRGGALPLSAVRRRRAGGGDRMGRRLGALARLGARPGDRQAVRRGAGGAVRCAGGDAGAGVEERGGDRPPLGRRLPRLDHWLEPPGHRGARARRPGRGPPQLRGLAGDRSGQRGGPVAPRRRARPAAPVERGGAAPGAGRATRRAASTSGAPVCRPGRRKGP